MSADPQRDAIADAAEREAALDPSRSFIVQAPAGSGKTELLTQRLLALLATVDEPEEVVAMTFTRKAAAEMRHRVFGAISRAMDAEPPASAHARKTWTLARAVLQRSQARQWRLQDTPQRLRIVTIDSLCAQITQQSPLTSGFGGRVAVTEFAEPLYREAARAVLDLLDADSPMAQPVARVLRHFDNRSGTLEQQLVNLLPRRDQWLRLVTREQRAQRPREALEAALDWVVTDAVQRAAQAVPESLRLAWCESAAYAAQTLAPEDARHPLRRLGADGWPEVGAAALPQWHALVDLVLTGTGTWRKTVNVKNGFPAGKGEPQQRKQDHLALIEALAQVDGLDALLDALRGLPQPQYSDAQWAVLEALLDTLLLTAAQLRLVFAARGEVDFAEIAGQAVAALGDAEAPSELALRMDYRVQHLLVDEFQDTSEGQWQLLLRLTAGWSEGDGRTLFVVGDPMQSIYRFREADVGLYLRAWRDGIGNLRLHPLRLRCNFRSCAAVVAWVNDAFARVLPAQADLNRSAVPYSAAIATQPDPEGDCGVTVHPLIDAGPAQEAEWVVERVRAARAAAPDGSIAILVRGRGHLLEIAPRLRAAGINYRAVDIESLAERPVIEDLRALTWALLHPMDRSAWLALLRAPWCGLVLADLYALAGELPASQSLLAALRDPERLARLSVDGAERLQRTLAVIDAALAEQGRRPLRRWIEATWVALGGPGCAGDAGALADAAVFFDCLQQLAPGAVLDDFDQLDLALAQLKASPDPASDGGVSLMTIHKSKGLEFDTVIVPGLARGTRSDDQPLLAWAHLTDVLGESRLLLAPVHARGDERDPAFDFVRGIESGKQQFEDARLLYVAATRARRQLHLFGEVRRQVGKDDGAVSVRAPTARSLLARLWPAVAAQFERAAAQAGDVASSVAGGTDRPVPPLRRRSGFELPLPAAGLPLVEAVTSGGGEALRFDWAGELARSVGVVFHRWAQLIAEDDIDTWTPERCAGVLPLLSDDLQHEGVPAARCDSAAQRVQAALANLLADPRGRRLLDRRLEGARSEYAVTAVLDAVPRRLVIDRSFVDDGVHWIVDFKTSTHEGGDVAGFVRQELERYSGQLRAYCTALRRLEAGAGGRPVRAALYLPLIEDPALRWIELPD
ncbi:DNA helicase UvrD [Sinimarinibacterium sp. CAU 1509]|uniref:UvrD-helicase domain-containing protein n=1 Tax=Sinimarinibacterium sp. CAU 1509 TaxID=2562283 RepID=UPI0010ABDB0D|nr:UvrD-helicase domain-containing protein [Sinimarinibacterium sp. CAU 1509]TJY62928.1 DNA helicase UvrD [Sinimarinibacterium sp. CAU 1509]